MTYNLLAESLICRESIGMEVLVEMLKELGKKEGLLEAIKEHYPHKVCPLEMHEAYLEHVIQLCEEFPGLRCEFLEIIIENIIKFDTEFLRIDRCSKQLFPKVFIN